MTPYEMEHRAAEYAATVAMGNGCMPRDMPRPAGPLAAGETRLSDGRYAAPTDDCGVTFVRLPNGTCGWRIGPNGQIFDRREHAVKRARYRLDRYRTV